MTENNSQPAVSVVVPLYNEEENVAILQAELAVALAGIPHEIIFVDDGSTDQTLSRLTKTPEVRVLRFEKNAGQSAAMYAGTNAARGATVVLIDEDTEEKKKYQIVGDVEADVKAGRISISSPIARALIGKVKGDTGVVTAPVGARSDEVRDVKVG